MCKNIETIKDEIIFVDYEEFKGSVMKLPSMSLLGKRFDSTPELKLFQMVGDIGL